MATDATGAPTPLGIPKYNTSADAPSGLGFNAAMDALDALIAARVTKPGGIVAGQIPVWNGSAFVAKNTSQITTSAIASGPPASPSDGDIWIATAIGPDVNRWAFQYNAASASAYKWEFIGGPPMRLATGGMNTASTTPVALTGGATFTIPRNGDYWGDSGMSIGNSSGFTGSYLGNQQLAVNGVQAGYFGQAAIRQTGDAQTTQTVAALAGKVAGDVISQVVYQNGTTAVTGYTQPWFKITPIRIA